jgi:surfactin synthase thioesterase subunit
MLAQAHDMPEAWHVQFLKARQQFNRVAMTGNESADREMLEGYRLVATWEALADEQLCEFLVKHLRNVYRLASGYLAYDASEHELSLAITEFWQRDEQRHTQKAVRHA